MEETNPEGYFDTTYNKIKKAFKEYQDSLVIKKDDDEDDGGFYSEPFYNDLYLDSIPDTTGLFYELLDSDNYLINILGEPFYMLHTLAENRIIPESSELFGLASFFKFNKSFTKRKYYLPKVSKQEFFYNQLEKWRRKSVVVDKKFLWTEFGDILREADKNESWKEKSTFEKIIFTEEGFHRIYKLLSDPHYIFITDEYLEIFKNILPRGVFTSQYSNIVHSCITSPTRILVNIKEDSIFDFNPLLEALKQPDKGVLKYLRLKIKPNEIKLSTYGVPDDVYFFQNALLKNKFKNAILIADLYASSRTIDYQTIHRENFERFIDNERSIKDSVRDWEDTLNEYGIHEDEL